jgi:hypothetical protein
MGIVKVLKTKSVFFVRALMVHIILDFLFVKKIKQQSLLASMKLLTNCENASVTLFKTLVPAYNSRMCLQKLFSLTRHQSFAHVQKVPNLLNA